jgi:hypothetical protein
MNNSPAKGVTGCPDSLFDIIHSTKCNIPNLLKVLSYFSKSPTLYKVSKS